MGSGGDEVNYPIYLWNAYGLYPIREHRFALPRNWRFDFAWPDEKIAVEIEGGIWTKGRHTRGKGFLNDLEKYNAATLEGWKVYRFTPDQLKKGHAQSFMLAAIP